MDSDLFSENVYVAEDSVLYLISLSLSYDTVGFMNRIKFSGVILSDHARNRNNNGHGISLFSGTIKCHLIF